MENSKINIKDIEKLAEMSGLIFSQEEKENMVTEVSGIIEMLNLCEKVKTNNKNEDIILGLDDLRPDEIKDSFDIDISINSPSKRKGCIVVPKVVD